MNDYTKSGNSSLHWAEKKQHERFLQKYGRVHNAAACDFEID